MKLIVILLVTIINIIFASYKNDDIKICVNKECKIENNCRCSSTINPAGYNGPQLVALTISESIVTNLYESYWKPLLFNRINPDGKAIGATFYINHEYTDYHLVQNLYLRGFEIGVHSITKNSSQAYWRRATRKDLIDEFLGQKQIISNFANIPIGDITGARTPQLQLENDISIQAYEDSKILYDNSWPTLTNKRLLPYTLDFASTQSCTTMSCPRQSHPGFWIVPLTNIKGKDNVECNSLAACGIEGSSDDIAQWLLNELNRSRSDNRAPLVLRLDSYWFWFTDNSFEGFRKFLDEASKLKDVFFVSVSNIIDWIRHPVNINNYRTPIYSRSASCLPRNCMLRNVDGNIRYMTSCIACPDVYPWKGNPNGDNVEY